MSRRRRRNSEPLALNQIDAVEQNDAGSGLDQPEDQASQRAFAGARFAHQAQRFAFLDVERNIVHGANFTGTAAAKCRFGEIENLGQVADFEQRHSITFSTAIS